MKIAIIVSTFPPYFGGIGNVALENARELARRGHEVTVFTPRYGRRGESTVEQGIKVKYVSPFFRYGNAAFLPQLCFAFKNFDVVHLHYPFFGGAEPVAFASRWRKNFPKFFLTYHMDVRGKGFLRYFFSWHTKYIMPRMVRSADGIAVTSADYAEHSDIQKMLHERREKFCIIPNGADTDRFSPEKKETDFFAKYDIGAEDRVLLFVGALDSAHYFKGLTLLLEALAALDPFVKLVVAGDGDRKKAYETEAEKFGVENRVKFVGRVPVEDLPKFFASADLTVLPSVDTSEAFGMVLVESLASGTPVVASDLPGVRSVVQSAKNGLLTPPRDAGKLARAIEEALRDPARLAAWGQYGRDMVMQKYDWKIIGNELERMYKKEL